MPILPVAENWEEEEQDEGHRAPLCIAASAASFNAAGNLVSC